MDLLRRYRWPRNVRELRNIAERLLLTGGDARVSADDLPPEIAGAPPQPAPIKLDDAERDMILRAIDHERGNIASAARRLGISRSTLYRRIERYGLATDGAATRPR